MTARSDRRRQLLSLSRCGSNACFNDSGDGGVHLHSQVFVKTSLCSMCPASSLSCMAVHARSIYCRTPDPDPGPTQKAGQKQSSVVWRCRELCQQDSWLQRTRNAQTKSNATLHLSLPRRRRSSSRKPSTKIMSRARRLMATT